MPFSSESLFCPFSSRVVFLPTSFLPNCTSVQRALSLPFHLLYNRPLFGPGFFLGSPSMPSPSSSFASLRLSFTSHKEIMTGVLYLKSRVETWLDGSPSLKHHHLALSINIECPLILFSVGCLSTQVYFLFGETMWKEDEFSVLSVDSRWCKWRWSKFTYSSGRGVPQVYHYHFS